jgi:hypothetical protein
VARQAFESVTDSKMWSRTWGVLLATLLWSSAVEAQTAWPGLQHVRWPLLDLVMVPDSTSMSFVVGPNPATRQWESGSNLVDLDLDPVVALQWVTLARALAEAEGQWSRNESTSLTPPLRGRRGPEFVVLARNLKKASKDELFVFVVSDSSSKINWKAFASAAQVHSLLTVLEQTALASRRKAETLGESTRADPEPDTPVSVVYQPRPIYPARLSSSNRIGRVWMSYVVDAGGRADPGSFRPLLSDHPLFTRAAINALVRSRFRPALSNNQPVSQRVFQAIVFKIR